MKWKKIITFATDWEIMDEKQLIEGLINGSYDSFKLLYDRWVGRLYQFTFKLVKSETVAQDIVQETFIKIWETHETFRSDSSFKSFIFTIAYHRIINHFRTQVSHPVMDDYLFYTSSLTDENKAERNLSLEEFMRRLEEAKQKLSPRQREVFELRKEQNLSLSEIEQRMGITNQAVRNSLSAALKKVREELIDYAPLLLLFLEL